MTLTDDNKRKMNELWRIMKQRTVTKQEIMTIFSVPERTARDMVAEIAQRCPVIALSNGKGYRAVDITNPADFADAVHCYNENRKRAEEILKRNDALAVALGRPKHVVMEVR